MKSIILSIAALGISILSFGQIPKTLSFQGVLINTSDGQAVNGTKPMTFQLFDAIEVGTTVWGPETHATVVINDGTYSVMLGAGDTPVPLDIAFDKPYFLEITIDGETLSPRVELGSSGYDLNTHVQDLAMDGTLSDEKLEATIDRTGFNASGYITAEGGIHVGGTSDPGADNLVVDGQISSVSKISTSSYITTTGGVHVGGTSDPGDDNLIVDGGIHIGGISDPGPNNLLVDGTITVNGNTNGQIILSSSGGQNSGIKMEQSGTYLNLKGTKEYYFSDWEISMTKGTAPFNNDLAIYHWGGSTTAPQVRTAEYYISQGSIYPSTDNGANLGTSSFKWSTVYATNGVSTTSDLRKKQDINEIGYGLRQLLLLKPVSYRWKSDPVEKKLGLIAQELLKIIPEVVEVGDDEDKSLSVYYNELIPVLIKSIQEQQEIIEDQSKEIQSNQLVISQLTGKQEEMEYRLQQIENLFRSKASNK